MTKEKAYALAKGKDFYTNIIGNNTVTSFSFNFFEDRLATIFLNVPDVQMEPKEDKKSKKKGKKASKQSKEIKQES